MKKVVLDVILIVILCAVTVLVFEGIHAVARWGNYQGSLIYQAYTRLTESKKVPAWDDDTDIKESDEPEGPPFTRLLTRKEIEPLIPMLKANAVGIGNSPFVELVNDAAATLTQENGCLVLKPNRHKTMSQLRSNLFNPFSPMSISYEKGQALLPEVQKLIDTYAIRLVNMDTNERGERVTLPAVEADRKVIVAGDSVAMGVGVDDSETISSQLQALDKTRQYINLGIGGASTADIVCALNKAANRYKSEIDELIYVYCENDLGKNEPYGTPQDAILWLRNFVKSQNIAKVTVVYAPYIYNVVPQITRFKGFKGDNYKTRAAARADLKALTADAGFRYFDISDLALAEMDRAKTEFAALDIFLDQVHLSPYGIAKLVEDLKKN